MFLSPLFSPSSPGVSATASPAASMLNGGGLSGGLSNDDLSGWTVNGLSTPGPSASAAGTQQPHIVVMDHHQLQQQLLQQHQQHIMNQQRLQQQQQQQQALDDAEDNEMMQGGGAGAGGQAGGQQAGKSVAEFVRKLSRYLFFFFFFSPLYFTHQLIPPYLAHLIECSTTRQCSQSSAGTPPVTALSSR